MPQSEEYSDERSPLLASNHRIPESQSPHIATDGQKSSTSVAFTITIAIFGILLDYFVLLLHLRTLCVGVLLASADECFVTATYSTIASEFLRNSDGPWLLLAYNLGYCYALPIVSHPAMATDLSQKFATAMGFNEQMLCTRILTSVAWTVRKPE